MTATRTIRCATAADAERICTIYNHYIATTTISFEEEPVAPGEMAQRIADVVAAGLPWLAMCEDDKLIGYACATRWRVRAAYRFAVESSVYLDSGYTGKGAGTALYEALLTELRRRELHLVIGGIAQPNEASVRLHERLGFQRVAHFGEVGLKFGKWIDVGYWQLKLDAPPRTRMNQPLPCLIIIDMQQCMADPAAGSRNNPQAEDNIAQLLRAWRAAAAPVVHVRHISRSSTSLFAPGQPGVAFQDALQPLPHEHVVEKNVPDAFTNSALERWLRVRGLDALVIAGVSTNNSVESSARTAGNLGFATVVVADATFAYAMRDYAGVERTADEVHAMALANLMSDYAGIQDTETLLADLAAN